MVSEARRTSILKLASATKLLRALSRAEARVPGASQKREFAKYLSSVKDRVARGKKLGPAGKDINAMGPYGIGPNAAPSGHATSFFKFHDRPRNTRVGDALPKGTPLSRLRQLAEDPKLHRKLKDKVEFRKWRERVAKSRTEHQSGYW